MKKTNPLAFAALTWIALSPQTVLAEITNCIPILSVPFTITNPGIYCVNTDLTTAITSGAAITVSANVVTIDLNGRRLGGGFAGTASQTAGILAIDRRNITIRNGTIRGFREGISIRATGIGQSTGHLIEDIQADGNTYNGIRLTGTNSVIRNNQVSNTGGSTAISTFNSFGLIAEGSNNRVLNNDIMNVFSSDAAESANGIWADGPDVVVKDNRVSGISSSDTTSPLSAARGIWTLDARAQVVGNQISGGTAPVEIGILVEATIDAMVKDNLVSGFQDIGVQISGSGGGIYSGNVVRGAALPYSGGTAHGTTNFP